MYDDFDKKPEETPQGDVTPEQNSFDEAYEQAFSAPENTEAPAQPETAPESDPEPEAQAEPAAQPETQSVYEDISSGAQSAETAPAEEIPEAQAQRIPNPQQQYGYGAYQQGPRTGYGAPSYGQAPGANGQYRQSGPYQGGPYGAPYGRSPYQNEGYYNSSAQMPQRPPRKSTGKKVFIAAVAIVLVFALVAGAVAVAGRFIAKARGGRTENGYEQITEEPNDDTALQIEEGPKTERAKAGEVLDAAEIAEIGRASNVGIMIYSSGIQTSASGQGSGIVMGADSKGDYTYIITCAHVISDKGVSIKVQTEEGKTYDAELVGYDQKTDVGVIKVKSTDLTPAVFGNSDELSVGDPVYAVGNPGGVEFFGSFTAGRVSAINRPISSEIGYTMKCIQHDAAINPGNSGGMLLNQYGQVVGINSQKIVSANYEGMNFSIPITSAKVIIDDLIQYGYVKDRAKISISYTSINNSTQYYLIAQVNNLPQGTLIITAINPDSTLVNTDAKKLDMIIAVNGEPLDTTDTLLEKVDEGKVGDKMTLTLARVNSNYSVDKFDVEVTLVEDKGNTQEEAQESSEEPATQYVNPFDYFFGYGY